MVKMKFTDNQTAFDYATYMIVGSYFKKTTCTNSILEKRMRLQYCEQKLDNQYRMEEQCIRFVEQELLPTLPSNLWNQEVKVRFVRSSDGRTELRFEGPGHTLRVRGVYRGKQSELSAKLSSR